MKSMDAIVKDLQRQGIRAQKVNIKQINRQRWIISTSPKELIKHSRWKLNINIIKEQNL
ncbi:hypothetical protein QUF88_11605 [Bacillus sp. DX1.1]|uniref:hypothetical protein n=1 Tax=unclassified Bacillus (in: firmicutes) TaxID=185979 RepID=UPI00256FA9C4|nr:MULTISPECIES: hypothetical protein [unclassified Bacillus (in: firmicutes)]MDM5154456.1 hypothetical protein [Bacillus sp. DX1.1]WJE83359.1 hypothetical protein QRE67_09110 [Bacillus sp. DX3.1]